MSDEAFRQSFIERFEQVAARVPDSIAIEVDGRPVFSYGALWRRAVAVGAAIAARGGAVDDLVGLAIPKSPNWIIGLLGAWWAGRAWMPLDPVQPRARRLAAIERAGCRLALVAGGAGASEPELGAVDVLDVESAAAGDFDRGVAAADSLAYVVFTSGSSGAPKGVAVTHAGLVPMLDQQIAAFGLGPGTRSLWFLATSFDASVSDVGTALLSGATLCLEDPARLQRVDRLLSLIKKRGITYVDIPPSVLARLEPAGSPACLETLVIGGEVCEPEVVRRWSRVVKLFNVYGPTEATVCTSLGRCTADWSRPLLGRPLDGVCYRLVGTDGNDVRDGEEGELWIGGRQLARGYVGDAELTARRFVERDGQRWYRSGDRAVRHGRDYEFAGRLDRQRKVRGMLVAPEEIEAALLSHPRVSAAAVVVPSSDQRRPLAAFVEAGSGDLAELRAHVRARLPGWMVPAHIERVESLPRTAAGKLDFRAIETLARRRRRPTGRAPASRAERQVARWFSTVLGIEALGVDDDFFALGGDSLAVVELLAAAASDGVELGPEAVSSASTVAKMSKLVDAPVASEEMTAEALRAEARALAVDSPAIKGRWPLSTPRDAAWRHVLVTGATGFLGRRVVAELLRTTGARLSCLVHPRDQSARQRLRESCPAAMDPRVRAVAGDVAAPRLGLTPDDWAGLADSVDAVVHLAARVSQAASYRDLRAANLLGVREVLELAATGRPKAVHYASTLSVFVSTDRNRGVAREDDDLGQTRRVYGGYAQTKWAAEVLVDASAWPGATYRLGLLVGDRETARMPDTHWLAMFLRGVAALGCAPRAADLLPGSALAPSRSSALAFDATPVDDAARALVHLATRAPSTRRPTFHLAGPRPVPVASLLQAMERAGVALERVGPDEWNRRLRQAGARAAAVRLGLPSRPVAGGERPNHRALELCQATGIRFDATRARAAGAAIGPVDDDWLARCVASALEGRL